jgi:hypothetical protein
VYETHGRKWKQKRFNLGYAYLTGCCLGIPQFSFRPVAAASAVNMSLAIGDAITFNLYMCATVKSYYTIDR